MDTSFDKKIFLKRRPVPEKLEAYGFRRADGAYEYETDLADTGFRLIVTVNIDAGKSQDSAGVTAKVIDAETSEEYLPLHVASAVGGFVGEVRKAYFDELKNIADNCFTSLPFVSAQANRVASFAESRFGEAPDFPFSKSLDDGDGVFRNRSNDKWYGVILRVRKKKLTKDDADEDMVDILNVKADEDDFAALCREKGVYPAYHMNHKKWVSVLLDETVPDERIFEMLEASRVLTSGRRASTARDRSRAEWIIPSNLKLYDIITEFETHDITTWRQYRNIETGDVIYIYVGVPYKAILYRSEVLKAHVPDPSEPCGEHMKLKITDHYPADLCTRSGLLKDYGVTNIRGPRYMPPELSEILKPVK